jgi:gas vesicle protein
MARKLFRGVFTGGLIGFVMGLLFAPQKGEETRKQVKGVSETLAEKAKQISQTVKEKSEEVKKMAKERFGEKSEENK